MSAKAITDKLNREMELKIEQGNDFVFVGSDTSGVIISIYAYDSITEIFNKLYEDNRIKEHEINSFWKFDEHAERGYLDVTEDDMKDLIKFESEYYYNICNF